MQCPQCGHESREGAKFCRKCGTRFASTCPACGAQAEPDDSGGRSLFLSPGVGYAVSKDVQLYGFLQLPLYQYVNGVQLTAHHDPRYGPGNGKK